MGTVYLYITGSGVIDRELGLSVKVTHTARAPISSCQVQYTYQVTDRVRSILSMLLKGELAV